MRAAARAGAVLKTHCKHGHELIEATVYLCVCKTRRLRNGKRPIYRQCRECHKASMRAWWRRRAAAAA